MAIKNGKQQILVYSGVYAGFSKNVWTLYQLIVQLMFLLRFNPLEYIIIQSMYIFFWTPYVFTTVFGFYTAPVGLKNLLDYLSHHKVPVQIHENSHLTLCDPPENLSTRKALFLHLLFLHLIFHHCFRYILSTIQDIWE